MTTIRAPLSTVLATVRADIESEAKAAAGANTTISKNEQKTLSDSVTKTAADEIRAAGGVGTTVTVDKLVNAASAKMAALIGSVNQATGTGATAVSQAEVKALAATNPDAGVRVARAYELITGKSISLDGILPLPTPADAVGELNAIRGAVVDFVKKELQKAAGTNDLLNATERASLPSGHLRDAAFATPPPRSVENVTAHLFNEIDAVLADCGVDVVNLGRIDAAGTGLMQVPFSRNSFFPLVAHDPEIAGLFADGVLVSTGVRPENIPGLPGPRFVDVGATPTPTPDPATVWPFSAVHDRTAGLVVVAVGAFSGGNNIFSAAERAALPDGLLRAAATSAGTPSTTTKISAEVMRIVDARLLEIGIDVSSASPLPNLAVSLNDIGRLVLIDPEVAGLVADAMAEHRGPRVVVSGLPPPRFMISAPPSSLGGPQLHGVPGAVGAVSLLNPSTVDAVVPDLHTLIDAMDASRNGSITLSEAVSFVKSANGGYIWDAQIPPENRPRMVARALFDIREHAYQRFGRSPTTTEVKAELVRFIARTKEVGVDDHNNAFDATGSVRPDDEIETIILFDAIRGGGIQLDADPYVHHFDHEGDRAVDQRRPLDVGGPAAKAMRHLVFHFNKAGNDNHWPLWSGVATSRYRLDVSETEQVVARIRSEPTARQAELFQAMVDWLSWHPDRPGLLYVNVDARPLVDALAIELGHAYRSPVGDIAAPAMPAP